MEYNKKSLAIRRHIKDKPGIVSSLINIMEVQLEIGAFDAAQKSFTEGFELAVKTKSVALIILTLTSYAYMLFLTGRNEESLQFSYFILGHNSTEHQRKSFIRDKYLPLLESQLPLATRKQVQAVANMQDLDKLCHQLLIDIRTI